MTEIILHRVNTIDHLKSVPVKYGVEVDLRSQGQEIIIHHDPFEEGVLFDDWLVHFKHQTLILNVKEEGLENILIGKMKDRAIEKYFFLDQSFPFLLKYSKECNCRAAVRLSEYEDVSTVERVGQKVDWVWVDCFSKLPLDQDTINRLQYQNLKLCIVSPELHDLERVSEIDVFIRKILDLNLVPDAICTKKPKLWEQYFETC